MSLSPLLSALLPVHLRALAALGLVPLTQGQIALTRAGPGQQIIGRSRGLLRGGVARSSFRIHDPRMIGRFGPIHLLSLFTLGTLFQAIRASRGRPHRGHCAALLSWVWGGLLGAGALTLLTGRLMHAPLFGA